MTNLKDLLLVSETIFHCLDALNIHFILHIIILYQYYIPNIWCPEPGRGGGGGGGGGGGREPSTSSLLFVLLPSDPPDITSVLSHPSLFPAPPCPIQPPPPPITIEYYGYGCYGYSCVELCPIMTALYQLFLVLYVGIIDAMISIDSHRHRHEL